MTFQPAVIGTGLAGWRALQQSMPRQREIHDQSPAIARDLDYFRARIGDVQSAEELVSDYRLLRVALGAFGLSDEIGSRALIRRVLAEGTIQEDALANKLTDRRYRTMARAFGFGDFPTPNSQLPGFSDRIEALYRERIFEVAVGDVAPDMRLALNASRELADLAGGAGSSRTKWFTLMGTPPIREVMEVALGLPASIGTLPIDRQITEFIDRAEAIFGTSDLSRLGAEPLLAEVLDRFTTLASLSDGATQVTSPALVLLRGF
ncbi:DUF1217 domain-containing protein [Jannaschia sp. KMU-145]|uniref:DUF1217 domain-containing protein n=1 Tax=Jannaschia halovivens TaxID=3388667 RepID=UPI00396B1BD4